MASHPENSSGSFVSPYITVRDVDATVKFYQKAFQFSVHSVSPGEDGISAHAELSYGGQLVMFGKEGAFSSLSKSPRSSGIDSPIILCASCDDVDTFYKEALSQGAKSVSEPKDMPWGYRMCQLQDPDDYTWCFMTPLA